MDCDVTDVTRESGCRRDSPAIQSSTAAGEQSLDGHPSGPLEGDSEQHLRETSLSGCSESPVATKTDETGHIYATAAAAREALAASMSRVLAKLQTGSASANVNWPIILIKATAGIGKTRTICQEIASGKNLPGGQQATIWFVVPNHRMAGQLVDTFRKIPAFPMKRLLVLQGRDQPDMCRRSALIARTSGLEMAIQDSFCAQGGKRCPYFHGCRYQEMRREARAAKGRIIVMPHASLVQRPDLPDPDLVVIDEAIWSVAVTKSDFSLETFDRVVTAVTNAGDLKERTRRRAARQLLDIRSALIDPQGRMLEVLRERKLETSTKLRRLAAAVAGDEASFGAISPDLSDSDIDRLLRDRLAPMRRGVATAIRQLAAEIEREREMPIGVTFEPDEIIQLVGRKCSERQARIRVFGRRQFQIPTGAPILLLDASSDPVIDRALWGRSIEYVHVRARRNLVASQSTSRSGSRRSLVHTGSQSPDTAADITWLQKRVAGLVPPGDGNGVAVFGSLPVIEALKPLLPEKAMTGHFNALRGINDYEECHTAIIVGREQPGCRDLEDLARSLFFEDDEPIRTVTELEERKVRLAGCNVEITSESHPDPRVQAVLAQIREREIEQAMDRLRFINDDTTPKTVILISRIVIDAEISMAMRFDHLCDGGVPFTRAIRPAQVVRLADDEVLDDIDPTWRARWTDGAAIRQQYARAAKACGHKGDARDILASYCPGHRMFEYQLIENGRLRSGRRRRALIHRDVTDPQQALQARYGAALIVTKLAERI